MEPVLELRFLLLPPQCWDLKAARLTATKKPLTPALRRLRQEGLDFEASLKYSETNSFWSKKPTKTMFKVTAPVLGY